MSLILQPIIFAPILDFIKKVLPDSLVNGILFGGHLQEIHKTEFAVSKFVERYKESIEALNRAFIFNIAFVVLALYPYFGLIEGTSIKLPLFEMSISVKQWTKVCPLISFALQLYIFVTLVWFMLLRRGLDLLKKELGKEKFFGDVSNVLLTGFIGILWLFVSIYNYFKFRWQYIWYLPIILLVVAIAMSPAFLCGYFIIQLYISKEVALAVIYSVFFIPSFILSLILVAIGGLLGMPRE